MCRWKNDREKNTKIKAYAHTDTHLMTNRKTEPKQKLISNAKIKKYTHEKTNK